MLGWGVCLCLFQGASAVGLTGLPNAAAPSQEAPAVAVELDQRTAAAPHFFADHQLTLGLRVYGAQGRRIDLRVQPFLLNATRAVPVGDALAVVDDAQLGERAWHELPFTLDAPSLEPKRETAVTCELRFSVRYSGETEWRAAGRDRIELYPADLLGPLRALGGRGELFVADDAGSLADFLRASEVLFHDLRTPGGAAALHRLKTRVGPRRPVLLWVRSEVAKPTLRAPRSLLAEIDNLVVFERPPDDFPYTTLRLEPERTTVSVDIATISALAHAPRAQQLLVRAARLARTDARAESLR